MAIHCTVTVRRNTNLPEHQLRQVKSYHEKLAPHIMTAFRYRCPNTDQQVQARTDHPPIADDLEAYQSVKCVACSRWHWVNPRTGRVLEPTGSAYDTYRPLR
jgi:hypothetical protein